MSYNRIYSCHFLCMEFNTLFDLCVIGEPIIHFDCWNKHNFSVTYFMSALEMTMNSSCEYDYIFLSTPVAWGADGNFSADKIERDVVHIRKYSQAPIIMTSVMPIGICNKLECHYLPLLMYLNDDEKPITIGCHTCSLINVDNIKTLITILLQTRRIIIKHIFDVEMSSLIQLCQAHINKSFQREISYFCSKNNISSPFVSSHYSPEVTPIIVYMVRQMEDIKLDCPILYSCLFRQHYIDKL